MTPIFAVLDTPIILVIVGVVVLLFGADRLPKLARSMGQAKKEFDSAMQPAANPVVQQPPADPPAEIKPPPTQPPPSDLT